MKRTLLLALFLLMMFPPVVGQQPPAGDAPANKEDIEKLFSAMHIREQMRSMIDLMTKQSKQMSRVALKKKLPDISQKDLAQIDAVADRVMKDFDIDGMIDDMIPVYQRHLTKADVAAMAGFYETPTGQKLLREQPQMTAEAMQAVQPRMEKMMNSVMDQAEQMAKESEHKGANTDQK